MPMRERELLYHGWYRSMEGYGHAVFSSIAAKSQSATQSEHQSGAENKPKTNADKARKDLAW
jgi:hypothetical protein